ncbi:MAG: hypothetical protein ACXADA_07410 [Candidatus Hodarchaeales archaeon]
MIIGGEQDKMKVGKELALAQTLPTNVMLHILFSFVSGSLLCLSGVVVFSRNKSSRSNQMFLGFFGGIGLHQILDGIMTYFLFGPKDTVFSNLFRDFSIGFLILGLNFGALAVLTIYYGDESLFVMNKLVPWMIILVPILIGGIIGDNVLLGGYYGDQPSKTRDIFGWIGITGAFIVYSAIIALFLIFLAINVVDSTVQKKILGLIVGFLMIISVIFSFDISFVFPLFQQLIISPLAHLLVHLVALLGGLITVFVLWSPLKK